MHHHLVKRLICCLQCQNHNGSYNQNVIVSIISSELLSFLHPNLVWWHIILSWSVLWKDLIAVFKVKVTVIVENFTKNLSVRYFQCHWYLCNQTEWVDYIVTIVTLCKQSRLSVTVTFIIYRHSVRGILLCKQQTLLLLFFVLFFLIFSAQSNIKVVSGWNMSSNHN